MNVTLRIAVLIALQTVALVSMIGMKQWTLQTGTPIALETQPIDPRSLFRGDYVRLNYAISTLRLNELSADREFKRHERIYVVLQKRDAYWEPVSIHHEKPEIRADHVAIKGAVQHVGKHLAVRYGIESYFIPEGLGRELEAPKPGEEISVRVAVDAFGNAGIQAILVNGQARYTETLL